ncbi:MAG: 6-hydroxymethylpterin diphosphokinase MptE-like protein [bacterium]
MRPVDKLFKTHPPKLVVGGGNPEASKYGRLWEMKEYREHAPGEHFVHYFFLQAMGAKQGAHVIDFGCGTGRGAALLRDAGLKVTMLDFARNCLDEEVRSKLSEDFKFVKHDLMTPYPEVAPYGYCTDMMEHIPSEHVPTVLNNILRSAEHVFFAICTVPDAFGQAIGETLHMTVRPYEWWLDTLKKLSCVVHWSENIGSYAFFYVTVWDESQILVDTGKLNVTEEMVLENVKKNCAEKWQQVEPHLMNDKEVMILGGGPSLALFEDDIRQKRKEGMSVVTLNGTYNWALDKGLGPVNQVVVDAREFNKRFTKPYFEGCKYFLASQCHPSVFEGLPRSDIYLWHTLSDIEGLNEEIKKVYPTFYPVPGGSTVLLRTIPLMRMLGFRRFHLYGCDSCLDGDTHHAYSQPENDGEIVCKILVDGKRVFHCYPWMVAQARQFITLVKKLGGLFDMIIYGDGLLNYAITALAEKDDIELKEE